MLNKQIVQGRLTHHPELKTTQTGVSVCSFTIASDDDVKRSDGTRDTDFIDCVAWRGTAELVSKFMEKGRLITVVGRPKMKRYEDKNGVSHKTVELRVDDVYFSDSKPAQNNVQTAPTAPATVPSAPADFVEVDGEDEDLPF
jgi:single-strand DNA-binding protein